MSILMSNNGGGGKMIIRASGGGGCGSWPSDSSHLTAGDGSSVTVGSGLSLSGGTLNTSGGIALESAYVGDNETTTSTSYTDLATVGPTVTVTVGTSGKLLVQWSSAIYQYNTGHSGFVGWEMSGANTLTADNAPTLIWSSPNTGNFTGMPSSQKLLTGLNPGVTTITMKYKCDGDGPWHFWGRALTVFVL